MIKYSRTRHLPWSAGVGSDDLVCSAETIKNLQDGRRLIVTEKMDGGNITLTQNGFHARSLDSRTNAFDVRAKARWAEIAQDIPANFRISAESLWARRSIWYQSLPDVLLVFGIWDGEIALDWDSVQEFTDLLGMHTVPVIYDGCDFQEAVSVWSRLFDDAHSEGFVLRSAASFLYDDFDKNVVKYVRVNHVRTTDDWRHRSDFEVNRIG